MPTTCVSLLTLMHVYRYADIYTSRVSNFLRYTPFMYFRSQSQVLGTKFCCQVFRILVHGSTSMIQILLVCLTFWVQVQTLAHDCHAGPGNISSDVDQGFLAKAIKLTRPQPSQISFDGGV